MLEHPDDLRVSDADRDRTITDLRDHCALGRLTMDEFTDRMQTALEAKTRADLVAVTRDLPGLGTPAGQVAGERTPRKPRRWTVAIMGGAHRKRRWRVQDETFAVAVMGGVVLDLREAEITGAEAEITAVAVMGSVEIVVPEGMDVELTGFALMGDKEIKLARVPVVAGMPRVVVRAFALMGSVTVRSKPARS